MRTPENFVGLLAAHRNSDHRLIERAKKLTPLEIETSTDPKIVRMRRMIYAVQGEIHRMRGFVRLEPFGRKVLLGRMSPHHEIGFEVAEFFGGRFFGTIIVLGDGWRSWASLRTEDGLLRSRGDGVTRALEELGQLMERRDGEDDAGVSDLWEVYYNSQDLTPKDSKRAFGGRISRRSKRSAGMETERGKENRKLGEFI
ncbi:DUF4130 domain-containing protein [Methanocrinis sp.]|uniref:DUF4130 domain-containing protein n=1 Tax=Methanocrinis sp. TaxID=3101522 RepID=UPI003D117319